MKRPVTSVDDVAYVQLSRGGTALIDAEDAEWVGRHNWTWAIVGYAVRRINKAGKYKTLRMHRALLGIFDPNIEVDHINGNKLDNRKANLRVATRQENAKNQAAHSDSLSGISGVDAVRGKWRARIFTNGREKSLGLFATKEEAQAVRMAAAVKYHGEFARITPDQHAAGL